MKCQDAPKILERDVQRTILDYLKLHRVFHWRHNVGGMTGAHKGKTWHVRFGEAGQPDIFAMRYGDYQFESPSAQIFAIEVKRPGGKQSEKQREWQERFEKAGGIYCLATSLEDVERILG